MLEPQNTNVHGNHQWSKTIAAALVIVAVAVTNFFTPLDSAAVQKPVPKKGKKLPSGKPSPGKPKPAEAPASIGPVSGPILVAQLGHGDIIRSVAFSPDGTQVLTASDDKTARLWDAASGKELRQFQGHDSDIATVAFSPDGKLVLTASADKTARLWDVAGGKQIRIFQKTPREYLGCAAFSPDGKHVLTGGFTPRLWATATGKEVRVLGKELDPSKGSSDFVFAVAFSPDGRQVVMGNQDRTARLWDVAGGKEIRVFPAAAAVRSVAFSADGTRVLGSQDRTAQIWDTASGKELCRFQGHSDMIHAVAFAPDGKLVLSASHDKTARLWDAASGTEVRRFQGHTGAVTSAIFSPDGKQVLTGSWDKTARLWDAGTAKEIHVLQSPTLVVHAVAFSPDGRHVLVGSDDKTVRLWDVASGKKSLSLHGHQDKVRSVAFSPDGKQMLTGSDDRTARLWDASSGSQLQLFRGHGNGINAVAFSPDGQQVLTCASDLTARSWNVAGGTLIHTFKGHVEPVTSVTFSQDGKQVLTGSRDRRVGRWDAATGKNLRMDGTGGGPITSLAVSPSGKQVLAGSMEKTAGLFAAFGNHIATIRGHTELVSSVAFSPNGRQVLTGSWDHTARLWDPARPLITSQIQSLHTIHTLKGHTGPVTSVAFSPSGKHVLTGSQDKTTRLWDTASGRELCQMISFRDDSWAVVARDNYYMASRGALQALAFRVGGRIFPFEQFDLKFNRPDKVVERLGLASQEMVAAYRHAYQKRLKRLNFTEDMLAGDFHVPEIVVSSGTKFVTSDRTVTLKVQASDSMYVLDRLQIDVNGVPLHGTGGISLRDRPSKSWEQEVEVALSIGKNQIDVSVLNEKGAESLKQSLSIKCDVAASKPNLYVVAVGVSDYVDARFRLTYADKDARDLAEAFESKRDRFGQVNVLRLVNREATRENVLKAKDFLRTSNVDDLVVVFFAGHGLLDGKLDYYFATADIDFSDPAKRGLPYETIEDLLDGIRARKKLLLMDTCHSGELDKEDIQVARLEKKADEEIKVRGFRGLDLEVAPRVGLGNSYQLLQEMFADLRRSTGAVVISSAGGAEYALESAAWKNGVFTHALLRGLKGEAEPGRDGRVQVSRLRDFVEQEVRRLTHGRQTPTSRRENVVFDFAVD